MQPTPSIGTELGRTIRLALPVVLGELGWMSMGIVDSLMVGRLGPASLGAVSVGRTLFMGTLVVGIGLLLSLDTMVSQAWGAGRPDECRRWLVNGTWLALLLAVPLTLIVAWLAHNMDLFGMAPEVQVLAGPYLQARLWGVAPLLLATAFRRYLQGIGVVRPIMIALVSANLVNAAGNWVLIHGKLGLPRLGVAGSGWATALSSVYLALFILAAVLRERPRVEGRDAPGLRPDAGRLRALLGLGLPAALHLLLDVGVFALATLLAARLAPVALAAHHVALTVASTIFMVPLGIHSAAAVRVGHAVGRGDPGGAWRAGWTAIGLGAGLTLVASTPLLVVPAAIVRLFNGDPAVVELGVTLLHVAAAFLFFDAVQGVCTGALRGVGDTRSPVAANLVGHWLLGLPIGYTLCFPLGRGAVGLWLGWLVGLGVVAVVVVAVWVRRGRRGVARAVKEAPVRC